METVRLGRTEIVSGKNAFGGLPIQRIAAGEAAKLLQKAVGSGVTFFDTARIYTDSEEKIGLALSGVRGHLTIATKTAGKTPEVFWKDLETSLRLLKTDWIDLYQFHNPAWCPKPGDGTGMYEAMLEAKRQGKIRFIGITNHRQDVAREAVLSGLYDTLQFPFCYLASEEDKALVRLCRERDVGFIAMKAMSGGLIRNSRAAYAFEAQFDNVLPIWGVQREEELDEFLSYSERPPVMDAETAELIEREKRELSGSFCRGCGYCLPCPAGIPIPTAARMSLMMRRSPAGPYLTEEWREKMERIENCTGCRHCAEHCPYGLDTPALLRENLKDYRAFSPA